MEIIASRRHHTLPLQCMVSVIKLDKPRQVKRSDTRDVTWQGSQGPCATSPHADLAFQEL